MAEVVSEDELVISDRVPIGITRRGNPDTLSLGPLQRYRIVAPLGKGGMADVFLAAWEVAPQVQRPVVIKRLHAHLGDDPNAVQMFIDEARLTCGFEHENIVQTIEVGIIDNECCIAMEYLAGQPLQQLLRQCWSTGGVPIEIAVHITIRALDALSYAHDYRDHRGSPLGIVHRDISPHNIFITNTGHVKLLDFGIAKARSHESHTATGFVKGKLAYIAPEQAQAAPVDLRADIWSMGVVLWEMLVGTRLFRAESDAATLQATLGAPIPLPSTLRSEVSPELDQIVLRALRRDVAARYPSASAMKLDLERCAQRLGQPVGPAQVSRLMVACFREQIIQQKQLVFELKERDDSLALPTVGTPTAIRRSAHPLPPESSLEASHVNGLLEQVSRSQRLLVRVLLGSLLFVTALASFVILTLVFRDRRTMAGHTSTTVADGREQPAHAPPWSAPLPARPAPETFPERGTTVSVSATTSAGSVAVEPPTTSEASMPTLSATVARLLNSVESTPTSVRRKNGVSRAGAPPAAIPESALTEAGLLNLDTIPWSVVSLNGKLLGQTPLMGVKLPPGPHVLTLRNPDLGLETQYALTIEPGKTIARRVGLQ